MRELVLTWAMAMLGAGCVNVVSHINEFDAGPPPKPADATGGAETSGACASGQRWMGTAASEAHYPGVACMGSGCHTPGSPTVLTMAGTIYPVNGPHDENNCNGINGVGVALAFIDEMGAELPFGRIQVNAVGNFRTSKELPKTPFKVKVIAAGREAIMAAPVTEGNCNSCHTPDGKNNAKGRIIPAPP